jgi:hypothetical protein
MRPFEVPTEVPMKRLAMLGMAALLAAPIGAQAQGQDSTPGERHLRVMAELLPGVYDNANQAYFDRRRGLPEADRHVRMQTTITRVQAPAFGDHVFLWVNRQGTGADATRSWRIATLAAGPQPGTVTMRHYLRPEGEIATAELATLRPADLRRTEGCDYFFQRRADHFAGRQLPRACRFEWQGRPVYTDNEIQLSRTSLWFHDHKYELRGQRRITGTASGEPFWLERARTFHCYADMPGVGGGRAEPFERYDGIELHDKGDTRWFRTRETPSRELALTLQAVTWHVLNEGDGAFNRNSLVLYVSERQADGGVREHGYAFTDPAADRIGLNLKWLLANCALVPRAAARPEM